MELQKYRLLKWEPEKVLVTATATAMAVPEECGMSAKRHEVRDICRSVLLQVCTLDYIPPTFKK